MELSEKIALVTGAGKRLGRAIALGLAQRGMDLAVHFNHSVKDAQEVARQARAAGRRAEVFQADLADEGDIRRLFEAVGAAFGRLDVLVNCAAVYHRTPLVELTASQWDSEMAVNARAAALCIRHALPLMPRGAAIVNIADSAAEKGSGNYLAYCTSKAALLSLTRGAALDLAARGIRVNAVSPGLALWQEDATEDYKRQVLSAIPMKREGSPADIVEAVLFLLRHDYITGQNLRVDGGWEMG